MACMLSGNFSTGDSLPNSCSSITGYWCMKVSQLALLLGRKDEAPEVPEVLTTFKGVRSYSATSQLSSVWQSEASKPERSTAVNLSSHLVSWSKRLL